MFFNFYFFYPFKPILENDDIIVIIAVYDYNNRFILPPKGNGLYFLHPI